MRVRAVMGDFRTEISDFTISSCRVYITLRSEIELSEMTCLLYGRTAAKL